MATTEDPYLSTEQAAREVGFTPEWVRKQIVRGRLVATVFDTGRRRTYRIRRSDWLTFLATFSGRSDDERFVDGA